MTKQILIKYSTLKTSISQVLEFTRGYVSEQNIDLKTSLGDDLSLWELDGYVFLDKFQERFNLTLPEMAYNYVCPENLKLNMIQKILFVTTYLLTTPFLLIIYPFMTTNRKKNVRQRIKGNKNRLTLGDLAATLAIGEFVKRENVKIELK